MVEKPLFPSSNLRNTWQAFVPKLVLGFAVQLRRTDVPGGTVIYCFIDLIGNCSCEFNSDVFVIEYMQLFILFSLSIDLIDSNALFINFMGPYKRFDGFEDHTFSFTYCVSTPC